MLFTTAIRVFATLYAAGSFLNMSASAAASPECQGVEEKGISNRRTTSDETVGLETIRIFVATEKHGDLRISHTTIEECTED